MNNSPFGKLNLRDLINGVVVAFLTVALTGILQVLDAGGLPTMDQLIVAGKSGIVASLAYLLKNIVSNSQGEMGVREPVKAEE